MACGAKRWAVSPCTAAARGEELLRRLEDEALVARRADADGEDDRESATARKAEQDLKAVGQSSGPPVIDANKIGTSAGERGAETRRQAAPEPR
jgi:hypothetical protein